MTRNHTPYSVYAADLREIRPELYVLKWDALEGPCYIPSFKLWKEKSSGGLFASRDHQIKEIDQFVDAFHTFRYTSKYTLYCIFKFCGTWVAEHAKSGNIKASKGDKNRYMAVCDLQSLAGYALYRLLDKAKSVGGVGDVLIDYYGRDLEPDKKQSDQRNLQHDMIKYIDDAEERALFRVTIKNGLIYKHNFGVNKITLYDTAGFTSAAGKGWGVFVMDHDDLYSGAHDAMGSAMDPESAGSGNPWAMENMQFYHSSFLAGASVFSAGEMRVENGRLTGVTQKSGHYHPGVVQLKNLFTFLRFKGVNIDKVEVGFGYGGDHGGEGTTVDSRLGRGVQSPFDKKGTKWKHFTHGRFFLSHPEVQGH